MGEAEAALLTWLRERGGFLAATVRPASAGHPRGVFACRDFEAGELIGRLPFASAISLGAAGTWESCTRLARAAYGRGASVHHVRGAFAPFWATQPRLDEILCIDTLTPELAVMLERELTAEEHATGGAADVEELLPFAEYLRLSALVTTRAFEFDTCDAAAGHDPTAPATTSAWLLPALDLLNCACGAARATADRVTVGVGATAAVEVRALGRLRAGEELLWRYYDSRPRADVALLVYGMVDAHDTRLAAVDTPAWDESDPFADTATEDPHPQACSPMRLSVRRLFLKMLTQLMDVQELSLAEAEEELARLARITSALSVPLEADVAALQATEAGDDNNRRCRGGVRGDARVRELLRFRVVRKAALRGRMDALHARVHAGQAV